MPIRKPWTSCPASPIRSTGSWNRAPGCRSFSCTAWSSASRSPCFTSSGTPSPARRLLGTEVEVSVGSAGRIAQLRLRQIAITINAIGHPGRADGVAAIDDSRASARDVLWIALAGPLASLAGAVLAAVLLSGAPATGVVHDLLWTAVLGGVFGTLNVLPFELQERRDGPPLRSDGRLALDALKVARALR